MEQLFDEKQAAQVLGCSVAAVRRWRLLNIGPAFCKIGRLVRYRKSDVVAFIEANIRVTRTA
jgi:hypothetical protein